MSDSLLQGFHHVMVKVRDFDRSVSFYQALGAQMTHSWGSPEKRCALLDIGGASMELISGGTAETLPPGALNHFAIRTTDTAKCVERAVQAGATVTREVCELALTPSLRVRLAFVAGPDGESIEFFQVLP